jgi:DeoR/GlpR family transcriptional regulator of sugar metabolism
VLAAQRKELLVARLDRDRRVVAKDIAAELDVSEDTIRRDLRDLAQLGRCQRVYGGALPTSPAVVDYGARRTVGADSKPRVAAAAAGLVKDGDTVLLDGGTTALAVARALPTELRATVITHSPTVAVALAERPHLDIQILGGRLFRHSMVACGAVTVEHAQRINADLFLLGVTGVHPDTGLTTGDADEAAMKRALARRAAETYVMASAEKIGTASPFAVLALTDVAGIVTDAPADDEIVRRLAATGVTLIHA